MKHWFLPALVVLSSCASGEPQPVIDLAQEAQTQEVVRAPLSGSAATELATVRGAYHQHLFSPRTAALIDLPKYETKDLLADLDRAGINRAVVLSMGFSYGDDRKNLPDADLNVREENDWTAGEVARSRGRLIGFCSVNPLRDAALAEVERCLRLPGISGLKLHFGNSGINLRNPDHVSAVARVLASANMVGAAIIVHMRPRTSSAVQYGAQDAQIFIEQLLPSAPDTVVQIAHLAGAGGFPEEAEKAINVFAEAIARKDPRTRNLWFDITTVAQIGSTKGDGDYIAKAIRAVGVNRTLFGSDAPLGGNAPPAEAWALFRAKVPLTKIEFQAIAEAVPPYARRSPS